MPPIGTTKTLAQLAQVSTKLNASSLSNNIAELRRSRSTDRIQQLQTEAIVELYDTVKQLQDAIFPLIGAIIPDGVGAVRDAASGLKSSAMMAGSARSRLNP